MSAVGVATESAEGQEAASESDWRPFFCWSVGAYLLTVLVLLIAVLRRTHGHLIYVIDDPAIHLGVAQNLIHHGTWGVAPGHFQSASSSPVWTVIEAVLVGALPFSRDALPLLLNLAAGIWLLWILAHNQTVLRPSLKRPWHVVATVVAVIAVLYLPQLAFAGMEHTLHAALVIAAIVLFFRRTNQMADRWPSWLPYALLAVATLTRFETTFVAFGIGVGLLLPCFERFAVGGRRLEWKPQLREALMVGLASGVPLLAFSTFNRLMGGGLLPNSVLDKSQLTGVDFVTPLGFGSITTRLVQDPLVAASAFIGLGYLVFVRPSRNGTTMLAAMVTVAVALHVTFAQVGWFDRYQNYLIVIGVYVALQFVQEQIEVRRVAPEQNGERASVAIHHLVQGTAVVLAFSLFLAPTKMASLGQIPRQSQETYQQRYQMARFLQRYYDGQPIATGELGYISMLHSGPITDLLGLGTYDVLKERQKGVPSAAYWEALAKKDGFRIVAIYPTTINLRDIPRKWIAVGSWQLQGPRYSAFSGTVQFWATTPEAVAPMIKHLKDFAKDMPAGNALELNALAQYRADLQLSGS